MSRVPLVEDILIMYSIELNQMKRPITRSIIRLQIFTWWENATCKFFDLFAIKKMRLAPFLFEENWLSG